MRNMTDLANQVAQDVAKATEASILEQLNDFVSRGLIEIQITGPTLVQDFMSNKILVQQQCRLVLKDKMYIENLEKENAKLKALILLTDPTVDKIVMNPLSQTQWTEFDRFCREELKYLGAKK